MGLVKLVLKEDVSRLGQAGDIVTVKPGYARNYLLPKGKAVAATEGRVKEIEHHKRVISDQSAKLMNDLAEVKKKIEALSLEFEAQAGGEGKLFGSITSQQLGNQLAEKGIQVDRRKITLAEPIRSVGEHRVEVRLGPEFTAELKVVVRALE